MTQQNFLSNESGAVTVDWVVLTAALVGLGLAVMGVMSSGVENQSRNIETQLSSGSIIRTGFTGDAAGARDTACGAFGGCDASLSSGALQDLTTAELDALAPVTYGDDYLSNNALSFDGDGNLQVDNGDGTFSAADQATTDAYNTAAAAQSSQNALIDAEKAARAN